jgi:thioredoxin-related protein
MAPIVHGLEAEYYGKVQFTYLDADDQATKDFQRSLGLAYHPEFYLLDGAGNVLQKWFGFVSADDFRSVFAQHQ